MANPVSGKGTKIKAPLGSEDSFIVRQKLTAKLNITPSNLKKVLLVLIYSITLAISVFLLFGNLGNEYLWQDEALTAFIGKTVIQRGLPYGDDGLNFVTQNNKLEWGQNGLWKWHPWLQYYIAAASMKLFGFDSFGARFLFSLFGLFTIIILYFLVMELFSDKKIAFTSVLVLIFMVPFLLLSRQCRYYSPLGFFFLLSILGYLRAAKGKKYGYTLFTVAMFFLFHTQYVYCAPAAAAVLLHAFLYHKKQLKPLALLAILVFAVNFPIYLLFYNSNYIGKHFFEAVFARLFSNPSYYISCILKYILPDYIVTAGAILIFINIKNDKKYLLWTNGPQEALNLVFFLTAFTFMLFIASSSHFFRYLGPLLPFFALVTAIILIKSWQINPAIPVIIIILLLNTYNIKDYLYEITHNYDGPIKGISKYLNEYAKKGDVVAMGGYDDIGLKFHTGLKVVGGESMDLNKHDILNAKWVIIRKYFVCSSDEISLIEISKLVDLKKYKKIVINYPDTKFENRETPEEHMFRTAINETRVVIYKKIY